ncbi:hypothetical protein CTTA_2954 [Comamonas testosteroni]|uniref:KAP NTPase domain-containing protein n=1 Tax=Comamonas testosteroni TaxID=285 RepID=A0A5A7MGF9_COMTE|nr:KAP family NTPase [Comamonas testosteroni]GEQ75949.1 hypothetical protein CTTA_2954 [Comamonas testosteroni]
MEKCVISTKNPEIKMPELQVFVRSLIVGFAIAEVLRIAFYLGTSFEQSFSEIPPWLLVVGSLSAPICLAYFTLRGGFNKIKNMYSSRRIELLIALAIGIWGNYLLSTKLEKFHKIFQDANPQWAPVAFIFLCTIFLSPIIQFIFKSPKKSSQLYFIVDDEAKSESEDVLDNKQQAKSFAETVLASGSHSGLVFGVDGPWGVGKTSFINFAEQYWTDNDQVIVCRFEPLRYASEPDLTGRLIRDLSASIQKSVFAPEFRSTASRYSRLIRGKADFSFFGFKLSLDPSLETFDDLLEDINDVLIRIDRRVIIVIDDLDRLDAKSINNVLFATRRTFRLSQATYILCYDTEVLAVGKGDDSSAREFLEKFVTVKLSLFVDSSSLISFLRRDWQVSENHLISVPSDTMIKLGEILDELADILDGDLTSDYWPLVGSLRKVKRFINALLMMQMEKSDLSQTDFNKTDLINLVLLHLYYPGIFRRIYTEETDGRTGIFSVKRDEHVPDYINSDHFNNFLECCDNGGKFLLKQLFDVEYLGLQNWRNLSEEFYTSRACFNHPNSRNLEKFLKLIVRFATPEPHETFIMYQNAVHQFRQGTKASSILESFRLSSEHLEYAHDQFWRILVSQSHDLTVGPAQDAIGTIIDYLPRYSSAKEEDRGLRQRSIFSLLKLLDNSGWGRTENRHLPNSSENIVEIAWRIFGENKYSGKSIIQQLAAPDRGILGWYDLMIFRLHCSFDRGGQLHNLQSALIIHQDKNAPTAGSVNQLAKFEMRLISQRIFSLFKSTYIDSNLNIFDEIDATQDHLFLGDFYKKNKEFSDDKHLAYIISASRSTIKSFLIYQLTNSLPPEGSGVGCGFYDEMGNKDAHGISTAMNAYLFNVCFNTALNPRNALHFIDYCLLNLTSPFYNGLEDYIPTKTGITKAINSKELGEYWSYNNKIIREISTKEKNRKIALSNNVFTYDKYLQKIFDVLDEISVENGQ